MAGWTLRYLHIYIYINYTEREHDKSAGLITRDLTRAVTPCLALSHSIPTHPAISTRVHGAVEKNGQWAVTQVESVSFLALWPGWLPRRVLFDWYKSTVPQVLPVCHSPVNTSPFEVISGAQLMANERERERERETGERERETGEREKDRLREGGGRGEGGRSSLYSLFSKI